MNGRKVRNIIVHGYGWIDLEGYDKVIANLDQYEDHSEMDIAFYRGDKIVRRLWNCPADITYEEDV